MVLIAPENKTEMIQAARNNEWPRVFLGMGCQLYLIRTEDSEPDPEPSWDELLQAIRADFWGDQVPLAEDKATRNMQDPLRNEYVVGRHMFKSLHTQLLNKRMSSLEAEVLKVALESDDWAPITVILLLFCIMGDVKREVAEVTRRAVQTRDWRYVDAVVVDRKKYHEKDSAQLLEILGLRDILPDKERTREVVNSLLGDERWDAVVLEIIVKTIACRCFYSGGVDDLVSWKIALEFVDEFQCETEINQEFLAKRMQLSYRVEQMLDLVEEHKKPYLLKGMFDGNDDVESEVSSRAMQIAYDLEDWPTFVSFFQHFKKDPVDIILDDCDLFSMIKVNAFDLRKCSYLLPEVEEDIDMEYEGYTLLHTAVDQWQKDSSHNIVSNIAELLDKKADINKRDPQGLTVLQKLVDESKGELNPLMSQRKTLIGLAVSIDKLTDGMIDWTPVPDNEWSVLHALCDEGDCVLLTKVLKMDNPFHHRQGLTLLDTTILSKKAEMSVKHFILRKLCQDVPGLVTDHVETVRSRPGGDDSSQYRFPLIYLLQLMKSSKSYTYVKLIRTLNDNKAFAEEEFQEARQESMISSLWELGMDDIITFLWETAASHHKHEHKDSECSA